MQWYRNAIVVHYSTTKKFVWENKMVLCLSSGICLSYTGSPDTLITIPSAVPINPGFSCFVIFEVFVTHCGVVLNFWMEPTVLRMEGLSDADQCGSNTRSYWREDHGVKGGQFFLIIICSLYFTKRCCVFASARTSLCGMGCLKSDDCSIYHQLSHRFLCTAATAAAH